MITRTKYTDFLMDLKVVEKDNMHCPICDGFKFTVGLSMECRFHFMCLECDYRIVIKNSEIEQEYYNFYSHVDLDANWHRASIKFNPSIHDVLELRGRREEEK